MDSVSNKAKDSTAEAAELKTGQGVKPVADPFFENTVKLPPRRELEAELAKWKRRALAFQDGYKEKSFEVTALEIQLMDLRAHGVDKVTARINESLKTKMLAACIERNEAKESLTALREAAEAALNVVSGVSLAHECADISHCEKCDACEFAAAAAQLRKALGKE